MCAVVQECVVRTCVQYGQCVRDIIIPQHLKDHLPLDQSALTYMMKCYPEEKEEEQMRRVLGRYSLTGQQQVSAHVCMHEQMPWMYIVGCTVVVHTYLM